MSKSEIMYCLKDHMPYPAPSISVSKRTYHAKINERLIKAMSTIINMELKNL
jgi:hypothetical protein